MRHFILNEKREVVPVDMMTWAQWLDGPQRIVAQDTVGRFWVSTVFIGIDSDLLGAVMTGEYGDGIPLGFYRPELFETMVFRSEREKITLGDREVMIKPATRYQTRSRSWDEAVQDHARAVKLFARYERMLDHQQKVLQRMEEQL